MAFDVSILLLTLGKVIREKRGTFSFDSTGIIDVILRDGEAHSSKSSFDVSLNVSTRLEILFVSHYYSRCCVKLTSP